MKEKIGLLAALSRLPSMRTSVWSAIALIALAALCSSTLAQEKTADYWYEKSLEFYNNGSLEESLQAVDKAIQIDNESAVAWMSKGSVLLSLRRYNESMQAYEKASEILNHSIEKNPKDSEAWWLLAGSLDNLGRSEAAVEAYDRVIDLNSSKALGAWIRKSDIFISLGRYNESVDAFDGALNLLPTQDKQSIMGLWWAEGTEICHNAWIADGQLLRTTSAWRNQSTGAIENIMMVNSDFAATWQNPNRGKAISPEGKPLGRHNEALQALSTNWVQYGFHKSEEASQVRTAEDWIQKGQELFRNRFFEGATEAYGAAIEAAGSNKAVLAAAWKGRGDALLVLSGQKSQESHERREEANESLETSLGYYDEVLEIDQEDAGVWFNKSIILRWLGRTDEALDAVDRAVELSPENIEFRWQRAELLSMLGRYNESDLAFEETIEMIPVNSSRKLAEVWTFKGLNFMGENNYEEALKAFEMVTELDPQEPAGWLYKGDVLKALDRDFEADDAFTRARELGYED